MEQAIELTGSDELRRYWGWYLALGIVLIVLGTIAIGSTFVMTIASVFFFGWLLIIGGVMDYRHVLGFRGGVSARDGACRALSALGLGFV